MKGPLKQDIMGTEATSDRLVFIYFIFHLISIEEKKAHNSLFQSSSLCPWHMKSFLVESWNLALYLCSSDPI